MSTTSRPFPAAVYSKQRLARKNEIERQKQELERLHALLEEQRPQTKPRETGEIPSVGTPHIEDVETVPLNDNTYIWDEQTMQLVTIPSTAKTSASTVPLEESPASTSLPRTDSVPLAPIRVLLEQEAEREPRETIYTSGEALILLVDHGVKSHRTGHLVDPDRIEMQAFILDMLAIIGMNEYVTRDKHIPFVINNDLAANTIKCISY